MKIGNYSVTIPEGTESSDGHVRMLHAQQYSIELSNASHTRCDAEVKIDDKFVGLWRVEASSSIRLERPIHDTGRFTFFRLGSPEAVAARVVPSLQTGVLSVRFKPELQPLDSGCLAAADRPMPGGTGLTGLTGRSDQNFYAVEKIAYDENAAMSIDLNLICVDDTPRPLAPTTKEVTASSKMGHANQAQKTKNAGWFVKKQHVSLGCQALALAIIWNWDKDIALGTQIIGSIIAVALLRIAFAET